MSSSHLRLKRFIFLLSFFIVLVSPSFIVTYYSYNKLDQVLTEQLFAERQALAKLASQNVEARLDAISDVGKVAASEILDLVKDEDWEAAVEELEHVSRELPYIDRIFLSDLEGRTVAYFPPSPENVGVDFSYRDWYKGVSENWEPYVSEVFKRAPYPQYKTVAVMSPIKDVDGTPLGAVGFAVNLNSFQDFMDEFKIGKDGFLYIVNQKGQVVAHPNYDPQGDIIDFSSAPLVQEILRGEDGIQISYNPIDQEERLGAYASIPNYGWGVAVTEPLDSALSTKNETIQSVVLIFSLVIGVNSILAVIVISAIEKIHSSSQKLRESNERFNLVSRATSDVVYDWDITTNKIWFADGMTKNYGYKKSEIGSDVSWWSEKIHPQDRNKIDTLLTDFINSSLDTLSMDYSFARRDGRFVYVQDRAYLVRDSSGKAVRCIGVMEDITKQKELEKLKDEFVSVASHELRTPMTAIKGFVSMILDGDYGEVNEPIKPPLEDIATSTERLINLVNDMLNLSRIESGRLKYTVSDVSIKDIIEEVITTLQPVATNKNLTLSSQLDTDFTVQADSDKVKQILNNLIGNSLKFTDQGSITVTAQKDKDMIQIFIEDTGTGISSEDQLKLFGKFQQISNQQIGRPAGTGLGLYISRAIAQKMGGDLWIESSTVGKGTVFAFSLPVPGSQGALEVQEDLQRDTENNPNQVSLT